MVVVAAGRGFEASGLVGANALIFDLEPKDVGTECGVFVEEAIIWKRDIY